MDDNTNDPRDWGLIIVINVLVLVSIFTGLYMSDSPQGASWFETLSTVNGDSIWTTLLLFYIVHLGLSLKSIGVDEQAMLLFFGRFVGFLGSGPAYVPFGLFQVIRAPKGIIEKDLPADPRKIWHGDETKTDGKVPKGYFPATRVTFAPKPEDDVTLESLGKRNTIPEDDAYLQRTTASVEASYGWIIKDLRKFVEKFGLDTPIVQAQRQMDDAATGSYNSIFSSITAAEAIPKTTEVAGIVKETLSTISEEWGIEVSYFNIKPLKFSHDTNKSVSEVAESLQKKKTMINLSEGKKTELTNVGKGAAAAEKAMLTARAAGNKKLAETANTPEGRFAMAAQVAQKATEGARLIIVPDNNLFGAAAGVGEMVRKFDSSDSSTPQATPVPTVSKPKTPPAQKPKGSRSNKKV